MVNNFFGAWLPSDTNSRWAEEEADFAYQVHHGDDENGLIVSL